MKLIHEQNANGTAQMVAKMHTDWFWKTESIIESVMRCEAW